MNNFDKFSSLVKVKILVTQLCLTLGHTMEYSLPGSSVHGILHVRILEQVAIPSFMGSSRPDPGIELKSLARISGRSL